LRPGRKAYDAAVRQGRRQQAAIALRTEVEMERILVALDASGPSQRALALAAEIACGLNAELVMTTVVIDAPLSEQERRIAETEFAVEIRERLGAIPAQEPAATLSGITRDFALAEQHGRDIRLVLADGVLEAANFKAEAAGAQRRRTMVLIGDPAEQILAALKRESFDLLVTGRRARGSIQEFLLGGVSRELVRSAGCAVAVVP
jgi:nucleotide-binding universal stress UspA family protein